MRIILYHKLSTGLPVIIFLCLLSCERYFEADPVSVFSSENVFENVDFTYQALLGVYQLMTEAEGYSKRLNMYYGVDTDIAMCSGTIDNGRRGIARYAANSGNHEIEKPWKNLYFGIERANILIDNIPGSKVYENGTDEEKKEMDRILGEALTLRSLHYYELIRNWGDVPYQFTSSKSGDDFELPRTDRDTIYSKLISDLLYAETLLPWANEVEYNERVTKSAAKGLLARISLARGGYSLRLDRAMRRGSDHLDYYQIVRDQCRQIMESGIHTLNPSFENIFKTMALLRLDTKYYEILFEVGLGQGTSGEAGYYVGQRIDAQSSFGRGDGGVLAMPNYYYSFSEYDTRRDITVALPEIDENDAEIQNRLSSIRIGKWRRSWLSPKFPGTNKFTGINWPVLRYSDILLMFAEAENELNNGPTQAAIDALYAVRARAFAGNVDKMPSIPGDYESFFQEIVKERAWEFGGECLRKHDLIRWNMLAEKLEETDEKLGKIFNREPPYENVPKYLVWRTNVLKIEYLNLDFHMDSMEIADRDTVEWPNVTDWGSAMTEEHIENHAGYFVANWKELLPVHQTILDVNRNMQNEYGY